MIKKEIYYWGPFIDNVATVKAIFNSAKGIKRYSKKYSSTIINAVGEWKTYKDNNKKEKLNFRDLNFDYYSKLPRFTFLKSRYSYLKIFFTCFFPLKRLLEKEKPDYLIIHLIVSLPLILFLLFTFKTKLCLRISGTPKLTFFRQLLWRISSNKIHKVFCPTEETKNILERKKIFNKGILVLEDPILEVNNKPSEDKSACQFLKNQIILIGRLTKQKNFELFINAFSIIEKKYPKLKVNIFGEGELKSKLMQLVDEKKLKDKVFLLGYKKNIFFYLKNSKFFVLSSLWEDPGFVLIEAALCNTSIISSDCPSGPKEFLMNGKGGFLFKNNSIESFVETFEEALNSSEKALSEKKIIAKLQAKKYSILRHTKKLENLIG